MNFNGFIFPCPKFDFHKLKNYQDQIIYIPKNIPNSLSEVIPCLFLHHKDLNKTKNFIIAFHGNAEDIFSAHIFAASLFKKTLMNVVLVEYPGYSIYKGESDADKILQNTTAASIPAASAVKAAINKLFDFLTFNPPVYIAIV